MPDGPSPSGETDDADGYRRCHETIAANPMAVRQLLANLRAGWWRDRIDGRLCATAELVLAEVLNNVVRHAQAGRENGRIEIIVLPQAGAMNIDVRDDGRPMPGLAPPKPRPLRICTKLQDLPEGGFGWHMIRALTTQLSYRREGDWNSLGFRVALDS